MKRIVLIGAGGFGREVAFIIDALNSRKPQYELLGFLDDSDEFREGMVINGHPYLGKKEWIFQHKDDVFCNCTIGNPVIKGKIQRELTRQGVRFESIITQRRDISPYAEIGPGCVFYNGVTVAPNCKIGAGVLLNTYVTVGHDAIIGDYTTVMPSTGISGCCKVGNEVSIGGHAFIIPGKKIGDKVKIAAGSIVFSNVKSGTTVLGNPAKRMKAIED